MQARNKMWEGEAVAKTRIVGISLYPGLYNSKEDIEKALHTAASLNVTQVFTSLHIPEANPKATVEDCRYMCGLANALGMEVTADVSPYTFEIIQANPYDLKAFADLGLAGLRVDFGFSNDELKAMVNNPEHLNIVINATDIDRALLEELKAHGVNLSKLHASHNFYPRIESGLSMEYTVRQAKMLKEYGITVGAFVASQVSKRAPLFEGLPTVEEHRFLEPAQAAMRLFATGVIDAVSVGDPLTPREELEELVRISGLDCLEIRLQLAGELSPREKEIVFGNKHRQRTAGMYRDVIRSAVRRDKNLIIQPRNYNVPRPYGTVTIDNSNYGRYVGELQIALRDLPADSRVNVVGRIIDEDLPLIDLIGNSAYEYFCFVEVV